jgi:hypothetical protein
MSKKKRSLDDRLTAYTTFYKRSFSDLDVEKMLEEGGQTSLSNFRQVSKGRTKNRDYWDVMFNNPNTKSRDALGKEIFKRFIENGSIGVNKLNRLIVRKGAKLSFDGKNYRGGQFLPKRYIARRTN